MIANPPYGKDWKRDETAVRTEHERGTAGRFAAGLPRISDGQLLFQLHMLAHAKDPEGEQRAIIAFLDQKTIRVDALIAEVRGAIDHLKELRTALISAAVTGKIDVRDEASTASKVA
ncbi:MAG: hypothetical protein GEU90_09210 [Gemmatimonas sp.]|nr:hypothetical protein [Gemmatimonas sp.]